MVPPATTHSASGGGLLDRVAPIARVAEDARARLAERLPDGLPDPTRAEAGQPVATRGTGYDRAWLDGVTPDRPLDIVPTVLTNVTESITGERDERVGRALAQVALAGSQLLQAGLQHASRGAGLIASTSSVLSKVIPVASMAGGAWQIWEGWNELPADDRSMGDIVTSRTARTGMLQMAAGAIMFVPGIGPLLAGAGVRMLAAANELDAFSFLDGAATAVEHQGEEAARRVHLLDDTPTDPYDNSRPTLRGARADIA